MSERRNVSDGWPARRAVGGLFSDPPPEPLDEGERRAREAMESAGRNAGEEWKAAALELVTDTALSLEKFTTEDVPWGQIEAPHDNRARGQVMRAAAKAGLIQSTDEFRSAQNPAFHRRPMRVWESRIFCEAGVA